MAENPRIEELRRRVQADPASIAFAALAEEFRRVGRYEDAIEACRTGLQRHPAYLSARVTLGRALIETGDYDAAREELETVLRSAPENLAAIRGLAQIHERLGHSTEMDPDLAALHAEPIPVAAPAPEKERQPPSQAPTLSLDLPLASPRVEKTPAFDLSMEPAASIDPFAAFVPSAPAAAAPPPSLEPVPAPTPIPMRMPERLPIPVVSRPAPKPELAPEPELTAEPELTPEPEFAAETELQADAGPDPEVLATLARLEQFLAAIQLARHA